MAEIYKKVLVRERAICDHGQDPDTCYACNYLCNPTTATVIEQSKPITIQKLRQLKTDILRDKNEHIGAVVVGRKETTEIRHNFEAHELYNGIPPGMPWRFDGALVLPVSTETCFGWFTQAEVEVALEAMRCVEIQDDMLGNMLVFGRIIKRGTVL